MYVRTTYQPRVSLLEVLIISECTHRSAVLYNVHQNICSVATAISRWVN